MESLKTAKKAETLNTPSDELYLLHETAYQKALQLDGLIEHAENSVDFLKRKATRKEAFNRIVGIVGIIGFIFTVITWAFS